MKKQILKIISTVMESHGVRKHINQNGFGYSEIERNLADQIIKQIGNQLDLSYLTGVFNVKGIDGLQDEVNRLQSIGRKPRDIFNLNGD